MVSITGWTGTRGVGTIAAKFIGRSGWLCSGHFLVFTCWGGERVACGCLGGFRGFSFPCRGLPRCVLVFVSPPLLRPGLSGFSFFGVRRG